MVRIIVAVLASALSHAALADAKAGAKKAQLCTFCHRAGGIGPLLEAQPAKYLVLATAEYKAGKRSSPAMQPNVGSLSARDIADISAWFAAQPLPAHGQPVDAAMAAAGEAKAKALECASCHGAGFAGKDAVPRLAGQQPVYLRYALEEFAAGRRPHPGGMKADRADFESIAHYFGSLK